MVAPLNVLLLEDEPSDAALVIRQLRQGGYDPTWERVDSEEAYLPMLKRKWDIILSDFAMPQFNGLRALELLRERHLEIPFIIISGTIGEDAAVAAIKLGASDYFLKDRLGRLGAAVSQAIEQSQLRAERNAADTALRESEERFRALAEHIDEVFWLRDAIHDEILYVSPAYERTWGRPRPVMGASFEIWLETLHPEDRERLRTVRKAEPHDGGSEVEYRILRPDGTVRWIHDRAFAVHGPVGGQRRIAGVARDITEQKRTHESLRLLGSAMAQSGESILITDVNLKKPGPKILYVNGGFTKMTGYTSEEVLGLTPRILQGPLTDLALMARLKRLLSNGDAFFGETINYRKDGSPFSLEWRVAPLRDAEGMVTHFVAVQRDVTNRKQAEQEILWKTAFLEAQVSSSRDGVLVIDGGGREILRNKRLDELWRADSGYLKSIPHSEAVEWVARQTKDPAAFLARVEFLYTHPDIVGRDELELADGRVLDRYSAPVIGSDGTHYGRIWTFQDITSRKQNEQKLAEQAALIDEARDAILVRGLDHKILFWSKGAERLYGWTASEALGRHSGEVLYRNIQAFLNAATLTIEKGEWTGELEQVTKIGAILTVESRWTLLRDGAGNPKSVLAINSDITERKKVEAQFLRAQRLESLGTLAGGIAHDLNNMLAPILMGAMLLKMNAPNDRSKEVIDIIESSANRGAQLVKQVLSFARGVEGARIAVHVGDVINELKTIVLSTFPKNITFTTKVAADVWIITGDPTQLYQVLLNLCVNARDAMASGGHISICAENVVIDAQYAAQQRDLPAGRYVRLCLADSGCGIPQENIDKIFDPFYTTKGLGHGTGLGLATTLGIVRSHGGIMAVASTVGQGTKFTIHFPVPIEVLDRVANIGGNEEALRGQGQRVLLVDDEVAILTITRQTLEAFGYDVVTAENGAQAVGLYAENKQNVDIVVMDMMMPVMGGYASIVALRQINPAVKIIAASGLKDQSSSEQAELVGVKHFLTKPYSATALLSALQIELGRA